jgi:hypothetical protein
MALPATAIFLDGAAHLRPAIRSLGLVRSTLSHAFRTTAISLRPALVSPFGSALRLAWLGRAATLAAPAVTASVAATITVALALAQRRSGYRHGRCTGQQKNASHRMSPNCMGGQRPRDSGGSHNRLGLWARGL